MTESRPPSCTPAAPPTTPQMFARARGATVPTGPHRCYYCGGACGEDHSAKRYVKPTFTAHDSCRAAGSPWVCGGCVEAMTNGITLTLADGEERGPNQKPWTYSWLITESAAVAATKTHREWILSRCLDPPPPPYALCIAESGQKHLLYLTPVCVSDDVAVVTLEGERVEYRPADLSARLADCKAACAALGKPALSEPLLFGRQVVLCEAAGEEFVRHWLRVQFEPLTRLAVWLCPPKEGCVRERDGAVATD